MTDAEWRRVWELYEAASVLPRQEAEEFLASASETPEIIEEARLALCADRTDAAKEWAHTGETIGRYQVLAPLGRGGTGEVYIARDTALGREVALKFLDAPAVSGDRAARWSLREAQAASSLNHPYIVTIFEVLPGTRPVIVMERVEGESLRQACLRSLPVSEVLRIGGQIAEALAAVHARGLVHRDLKPENVMIRPDGYIKVLDFGLARSVFPTGDASTVAGSPVGTLRYMAPEQCRGDAAVPATDVFALALILSEALNGRHPFERETSLDTAYAIVHAEPHPFRAELPATLEQFLRRMLAKESAERPTAQEVVERLRKLSPTDAVPGRNLVSRRWVVGAIAVAGAPSLAWMLLRNRQPSGPTVLLKEGIIASPAFSPDGSRVAFSWKTGASPCFQIYVMPVSGGQPLRLTRSSSNDMEAAWSPDGNEILFLRDGTGEKALYVVRAGENGQERRVLTLFAGFPGTWMNAKEVALSERFGAPLTHLERFHLDTGTHVALTRPDEAESDEYPRLSPDGKWLVFSRFSSMTTADLFVVSTAGGKERRLTHDDLAKREIRWTPDGGGVLYRARAQNWAIHYVGLNGGNPRQVALPSTPLGNFDVRAGKAGGMEMVLAETHATESIWRAEIPTIPGQLAKPVKLISSASGDVNVNPVLSPDGLKIAFISTRTGSPEVWVTDNQGGNPVQLTKFGGMELSVPAWSPDGREIVGSVPVNGRGKIFIVNVESRSMRWISVKGSAGQPQFSMDGRSLTMGIYRKSDDTLWRLYPATGELRELTRGGAAVHRESADGKWLYFVRQREPGLFRVPAGGGTEEVVLDRVVPELYRAWAVGRHGIYYTMSEGPTGPWLVQYYDPAAGTHTPICRLEMPLPRWTGTLSVSRDERWMVFPLHEPEGSRMTLLQDVRLE